MSIYRFAAAVALVIEIAERSGLHLAGAPIGGNSLSQLGVLFGAAFVVSEFWESTERFALAIRSKLCSLAREIRTFIKELSTPSDDNE